MIKPVEEALIAEIKAVVGLPVEGFPDAPASWRMTHAKGTVLVGFAGSTGGPDQTTDVLVQQRDVEWDISVLVRNLRSHAGAYEILDAIRTALFGQRILGFSPLTLKKERFISHDDGVWLYVQTWTHAHPLVGVITSEDGPRLTSVQHQSSYGSLEVSHHE